MSEILSSVARRSCGGFWRSVPLPLASWTGPPRRPLDVVGRCAAGVQVWRQLRANRFAYHDACLLGPAGAGVGGALKVLALLFSFVCKRPGRYHLWLTCWRLLRLHEWVTFVAVNGWRSGKGGVPLMACRRRDGVDRGGDLTVLRRRSSLRGPHRARRSAPSDGSVIERERRRESRAERAPHDGGEVATRHCCALCDPAFLSLPSGVCVWPFSRAPVAPHVAYGVPQPL